MAQRDIPKSRFLLVRRKMLDKKGNFLWELEFGRVEGSFFLGLFVPREVLTHKVHPNSLIIRTARESIT